MNSILLHALVAVVVFFTHFQQGITGFGCTVLALPFVTLLLGLDAALPVLIIQAWLLAMLTVVESWRKIVWREFMWIAVWMAVGMPFGMWMVGSLPGDVLKLIIACFSVCVGIEGFFRLHRHPVPARPTRFARGLSTLFLPLGGVFQGAFASGGPLVVIYAARMIADKSLFRVTLGLVWACSNTLLIAQHAVRGSLSPYILQVSLFLVPVSTLGFFLGNKMHYQVNDVLSRKFVFALLIIVGTVLAGSVMGG